MITTTKVIRNLFHKLPTPLKERLHVMRHMMRHVNKALLAELAAIPVVQAGCDEIKGHKTPFVVLKDGTILYGQQPTNIERAIYVRYQNSINPVITEETIRVAMDVITRYLYPHAMPQLTMPYSLRMRKAFGHLQHIETINDFPQLSAVKKESLQKIFSPKQGESFLDIGSYMGYGAIRLSKELGQQTQILCVEADPDTHDLLEHNIRSNSLLNVRIIPKAIWNKENVTLELQKTSRQANSLITGIVDSTSTVPIQTTSVDAILKEVGCIDIISMTVNGAEVEAIEGAKKTLQQCEHIRLSIAGWYKRDGKRICDIISPVLQEMGLEVVVGQKGMVLAYK